MPELDLSSLRLTDEEKQKFWSDEGAYLPGLADAQLAKALWRIQAWLESYHLDPVYSLGRTFCLDAFLRDQLLAAEIPRPKDA